MYLLETGKPDLGLAELQKLCKQDPGDRQLRNYLVRAYVRSNRLPDARSLLAAALKQNSQDADALFQRGAIELATGDVAAAENDLHQVLHGQPNSAPAHFAMSRVSLARGDVLSRRQELADALRLDPQLLPARLELARVYLEARSPATALSLLDQVPDGQKTSLSVLIERNWALAAAQNFTEFRKGIQKGLAVTRSRELLLQDAALKFLTHELSAARPPLEEILARNPADLTALDLLARTYLVQKQPKMALEKVRKYAAQRPASAPLQFMLGRYMLENGNLDQARAAFLAAKAADPHFYAADIALARASFAAGHSDAARQALGPVLASNDPTSQLLARLLLGDVEQAAGNHAAELAEWRKAVAADHNNVVALNNLAYALLEYANQPDEALRYAQQAVELAPDNPAVRDTLGWAFYRKGIYASALEHLEDAVARDGKAQSTDSTVRKYHLAMAYLSSGQHTRGLQMLRNALRLDPNLREAAMAQQILGESQ